MAGVHATKQSTSPSNDRRARDQLDRKLFDAWAKGDGESGKRLVNHYFPLVRKYFRHRALGDHEDLVQETFARVFDKHGEHTGDSFRAFAFGVARMVCLEYFRRRCRRQAIDPWTDSLGGLTKGSLSSRLAKREDHRLLLDALAMLPLADQDLVELYYWQELTGPELAGIFKVREPTIRSRLAASRKRLVANFNKAADSPHGNEYTVKQLEAGLLELRKSTNRSREDA